MSLWMKSTTEGSDQLMINVSCFSQNLSTEDLRAQKHLLQALSTRRLALVVLLSGRASPLGNQRNVLSISVSLKMNMSSRQRILSCSMKVTRSSSLSRSRISSMSVSKKRFFAAQRSRLDSSGVPMTSDVREEERMGLAVVVLVSDEAHERYLF